MAWKPKTIAGKILKGAVVAGGTVLGLAAGTSIVGKLVNGAKTVLTKNGATEIVKTTVENKGTTALMKSGNTVLGNIKQSVDQLKQNAVNLITGVNKEQRELIKAQKQESREYQQKLRTVEKLVNAGATASEARAKVGIAPEELTTYEGEKIQSSGMFDFLQNKNVLYILGGLAVIFLLTKKRR